MCTIASRQERVSDIARGHGKRAMERRATSVSGVGSQAVITGGTKLNDGR
jgi:hypothetical protein